MVKYFKTHYFLYQDAGTHIVCSELDFRGETVINTETLYTNQLEFKQIRRTIKFDRDDCTEITEDEYHLLRIS